MEKMKTDKVFRAKVMALESLDERIKCINDEGFECTLGEIKGEFDNLSEEDLQKIAEGLSSDCGIIL